MESTSDRIKLFLLHSVFLKKLPLKNRAHTINANLLDQFCKQEDGEVYPFREVSAIEEDAGPLELPRSPAFEFLIIAA